MPRGNATKRLGWEEVKGMHSPFSSLVSRPGEAEHVVLAANTEA
jgi:hypothetical protein